MKTKVFLWIIFIVVTIHFAKDITQDVLRVGSFLDVFGNVEEDLSFLPSTLRNVYLYGLGGLSVIAEAFLLISIPIVNLGRNRVVLKKAVWGAVIFLFSFLFIATLLDPRYRLF